MRQSKKKEYLLRCNLFAVSLVWEVCTKSLDGRARTHSPRAAAARLAAARPERLPAIFDGALGARQGKWRRPPDGNCD